MLVLLIFIFLIKIRLKMENPAIIQEHGFLKINVIEINIKKILIIFLYVFSEIFIIKNKINKWKKTYFMPCSGP